MGSIYFLLRPEYAKAMGVGIEAVFGLVMGVITGSSVLEAVVALVLVTALGKILLKLQPVLFKAPRFPRPEAE